MKLLKICIAGFWCAWLAIVPVWAQYAPALVLRQVQPFGHHAAAITCLFQDSRGFLWIGSEVGLSRFDGRQYKAYRQIGEAGLTDINIKAIAEDAQGNIWIGTEFGINKIDPFTEKIVRYYEGTGAGHVPYRWCNTLYVDQNKQLWFASEKGIARYQQQADSFINYPVSVYGADFKINKFIVKMLEDSQHRFWMATSFGVKLFDRKTGKYQSLHTPETNSSLRENVIYSLYEDSRSTIWAGTYAGGLLRYDEAKKRFIKMPCSAQMEGHMVVNDMLEINWGNQRVLTLATNEGFFVLPHDSAFLQPLQEAPTDPFNCLLTGSHQQLWVGGNKGLYRMALGHPAYTFLPQQAAKKEQVFHIIPHVKNKHQYYLTNLSGWELFDAQNNRLTTVDLPPAYATMLCNINQWQADENGYWFTSSEGFGYYHVMQNKVTDYTHLITANSGQKRAWHLAKDKQGKLWISMRRSGILVFHPGTQKSTALFADSSKPDNIYGYSVNDLQGGPDGQIYFTCKNQLYQVNTEHYRYQIYPVQDTTGQIAITKISPRSIVFSQQHELLVASNLQVLALQNGVWNQRYPSNGFSSFLIDKMHRDAAGNIFLFASGSLFQTNSTFSRFGNLQQLIGPSVSTVSEIKQHADSVWLLAQYGGVGVLKSLETRVQKTAPAPIISRVKFGSTEHYLLSKPYRPVQLAFSDAIEIDIASPAITNNEDCRLLYKLDGIDTTWKELMQTTTIRYEQLASGDYLFLAKTLEPDGNESQPVSFRFTVVPPFYKTWWFLLLLVATVFAAAFFYYRLRLRKALDLEKMRTKIATDLHDDIGATLSSIAMYSEAVKKQVKPILPHLEPVLQKMGDNSRDMVTSMSDIVWAINPANDAGDKLVQRMENYARDLCALKEIPLSFTASDKLQTIKLTLEQRRNIYLIFKEALNNALKYASATNMHIHFAEYGKAWRLMIADDGKGFEKGKQNIGNGLLNMEKRAKEIGGDIDIQSAIGKGTTVTLTFYT
jgi:signal transduction histidine kinase